MTRVTFPHSLSSLPASRQFVDGLALGYLPGREYLERYLLGMVRRNFSWLTIQQALSTLKLFLVFLRQSGIRLENLGRRDLEAFVEREQDHGLKLSSVKTKLDRVYAFLQFLIEEEVIPPEVLVRKIRFRLSQYLPRAMDPVDVRRLLSVIDEVRDRAMVLVLLRTGMRICELLATRASDVNIRDRRITIREGANTRRGRIAYLSNDARNALRAWGRERDKDGDKEFLFYGRRRNTLGSKRFYLQIQTIFKIVWQ